MRVTPAVLLVAALALTAAAQPPASTSAAPPLPPPTAAELRAGLGPGSVLPTVVPPALTGPVTFTCATAKKGATALTATTLFAPTKAGWDLNTVPTVANGICSASAADPFFFSIPVPPGNYRVTMNLGGKQASTITVRAEARRLYIQTLPIAAGKTVTRSIDVNVRIPEFTKPDGTPGRVSLKAARSRQPRLGRQAHPRIQRRPTPPSTPSPSNPSPASRPSPPSTLPATPPWSIRTSSPGPPGASNSPASFSPASSSPTTPSPANPPSPSSASSALPKSSHSSSPATTSSSSSPTTTRRSPTECPATSRS